MSNCRQHGEFAKSKLDMLQMYKNYTSTDSLKLLKLKSTLYSNISKLINILDVNEIAGYSVLITKAITYITENLTIKLTAKQISSFLFISESKLDKQFKSELNITLGRYIDYLIFLNTEKMLLSDMSIAEISEFLGSCDQFNFSRKFSQQYNMSPLSYRKTPECL